MIFKTPIPDVYQRPVQRKTVFDRSSLGACGPHFEGIKEDQTAIA
jgi:hypothetical protein